MSAKPSGNWINANSESPKQETLYNSERPQVMTEKLKNTAKGRPKRIHHPDPSQTRLESFRKFGTSGEAQQH